MAQQKEEAAMQLRALESVHLKERDFVKTREKTEQALLRDTEARCTSLKARATYLYVCLSVFMYVCMYVCMYV
jgi:hypothetical protein